jgi:hypothetical protein
MQYVAIAASVLSAVGSVQQGKAQKRMYKLQSKQAELKASREALQYEQQANQVLERMIQTNATAAAKGFAGGVSGFSGSAKLIQERNEKVAGRDVEIMQEGARSAISFGEIQSNMLKEAGSQALRGSYFDAIGKLGMAAYAYDQTSTGTAVNKAPVEDRSLYNQSQGYVA